MGPYKKNKRFTAGGLLAFVALEQDRSDAVSIRRVPPGGIRPQVAVEPNGTIHMIYFSGDPKSGNLFYVRSSASGDAFSRPLRVNSREGSVIAMGTIRGGQIALGGNGRIHVAWNGSNTALPPGPINQKTASPAAPCSTRGLMTRAPLLSRSAI